jgi:hypothetical protein
VEEGKFGKTVKNVLAPVPGLTNEGLNKMAGGTLQWLGHQWPISEVGGEKLEEYGRSISSRSKAHEQELLKKYPLEQGSWPAITRNALTSMATQGPGYAASIVNPAFAPMALWFMGVQSFGKSYDEQLSKGSSPETAFIASLTKAMGEVATEKIPLERTLDLVKGVGKGALSQLAKIYAAEIPGELIQTSIESAVDKTTIEPGLTGEQYAQRLLDTFKQTLVQTTLQGGAGVGARSILGRESEDNSNVFADIDDLQGPPQADLGEEIPGRPEAEVSAQGVPINLSYLGEEIDFQQEDSPVMTSENFPKELPPPVTRVTPGGTAITPEQLADMVNAVPEQVDADIVQEPPFYSPRPELPWNPTPLLSNNHPRSLPPPQNVVTPSGTVIPPQQYSQMINNALQPREMTAKEISTAKRRVANPPKGRPKDSFTVVEQVTPEEVENEGVLVDHPRPIPSNVVDTTAYPVRLIKMDEKAGPVQKGPELSDEKRAQLLELAEDAIATKKAKGENVPAHLIQKVAELKGNIQRGSGETAGAEVFGHPQATNIMPQKYGNLIPIKTKTADAVIKRIDKTQDLIDELQRKIGGAEAIVKGQIKGDKKKAKDYFASEGHNEDQTILDLLKTETLPELNRMHKTLAASGAAKAEAPKDKPASAEEKGRQPGPVVATQEKALATKQPWEMTKEENWISFVENRPKQPWNGEPSMPSRKASYNKMIEKVDATHKKAVQKALSEGKQVPAEVLAEYPDLDNGKIKEAETDPFDELDETTDENTPAVSQTEQKQGAEPETETEDYICALSDIPYDLAYDAHRMSSFVPDERAKQEQASYFKHMRAVYEGLEKLADTEEKKATLKEEFPRYRKGYIAKYSALLSAKSRTMSSMITGPSNFPTARNEKRMDIAHRRLTEFLEWDEKSQNRMERALTPEDAPIKTVDQDAVERLRGKISEAVARQEKMKAANKIIRSDRDVIPRLKELGLTDKEIKENGKNGFYGFYLTNNNARIKRLKEQLSKAEKLREEAKTGEREFPFEGGTLELDYEDGRLKLYFDGMPSLEKRNELKKNGFKWSPRNKAWQRQLTNNAKWAAKEVVGVSFNKAEAKTQVEETGSIDFSRVQKGDTIKFTRGGREYSERVLRVNGEGRGDISNTYEVDLFGPKYIKQSEVSAVKHKDGAEQRKGAEEPGTTLYAGIPLGEIADLLNQTTEKIGKTIHRAACRASGFFDDRTPEHVKAFLGKVLATPNFASEDNLHRRKVFKLNLKRSEERNEMIFDLSRSDVENGYLGIEGMRDAMKRLNSKGRKSVNLLIKQGDIDNVVYGSKELLSADNPTGAPVTADVAQAYLSFHQTIRATRDQMFEKAKELSTLGYEGKPWYDQLVTLVKDGAKPEDIASDPNISPEVKAALKQVLSYRSRLAELRNTWGRVVGYAPRNRPDGDWFVKVFDGETEVYMRPVKTKHEARKLQNAVRKNMAEHLKGNYSPDADYSFSIQRNPATPEEVFLFKGSDQAIEMLVNRAIEKAQEAGTIENGEAVQEAVLQSLSEEIAARGFARHRIARQENLVEGYDDTDYLKTLAGHVSGMSGWITKAKFAVQAARAAQGIPKDRPQDKEWVLSYTRDALRNATYLDQLCGTARSFAALMYLGGKISTVALNATQNYTAGQAELSRFTHFPAAKLLKAQKDVITSNFSDTDKWVIEQGSRTGRTAAQYVNEIAGLSDTAGVTDIPSRAVRYAADKSMIPFQLIETYWNREPALLAAFRVFYSEKGMTKEQAFEKAEEFVNNTHYVIGKENIPEFLRKLGPIGRTAYTFQSYTHNYINWLFNRLKQGEYGAVGRSMTALVLLGGISALPFGDDLEKWFRRKFGFSPMMALKKWIRKTADQYTDSGEAIEDFVVYGIPSYVNVNFSRALGVSVPFLGGEEQTLAERFSGVWGGMAKKAEITADALSKGQYKRALENSPVTPEAIANIMRAARQYKDGATSLAGKPILDAEGRQIAYTGKEAVSKGLGFNPLRPSKTYEASSAAYDLKEYWGNRRNDVITSFRIAKTDKDRRAAAMAVRKFNDELSKSQAKHLLSPIDGMTLYNSRTVRPDKQRTRFMQEYAH